MRFLAVLSVFLIVCQLVSALIPVDLPSRDCFAQPCLPKHSAPSACPPRFQHSGEAKCGTLKLKRKQICCPILGQIRG